MVPPHSHLRILTFSMSVLSRICVHIHANTNVLDGMKNTKTHKRTNYNISVGVSEEA